MWRVGLGVAANAAFNVSSCFALIVVRGPLRFAPDTGVVPGESSHFRFLCLAFPSLPLEEIEKRELRLIKGINYFFFVIGTHRHTYTIIIVIIVLLYYVIVSYIDD